MTDALKDIEEKLDRLLKLTQTNSNNIQALYRRSTALAHMVETIAAGREPRLPKTMRAEIDASVMPDVFELLARQDPTEFVRRYGHDVLDIFNKQGIEAITTMGDLTPSKHEHGVH